MGMIDIDINSFLQPLIGNGNSQYEWNILERIEKQQSINQSLKPRFQYFSTLIILVPSIDDASNSCDTNILMQIFYVNLLYVWLWCY